MAWLRQNGTAFLAADTVTVCDFHLFELLMQVNTLGQTVKQASHLVSPSFSLLQAYYERMEALPSIQRYVASPIAALPINNKQAAFGSKSPKKDKKERSSSPDDANSTLTSMTNTVPDSPPRKSAKNPEVEFPEISQAEVDGGGFDKAPNKKKGGKGKGGKGQGKGGKNGKGGKSAGKANKPKPKQQN